MSFASEKRALGLCDKCGFQYKLKRLKTETVMGRPQGNRVCPSCWDKEHPQNFLGRVRVVDAIGLKNPRSDSIERDASRSLPGWNPVGNQAVYGEMTLGSVRVTS